MSTIGYLIFWNPSVSNLVILVGIVAEFVLLAAVLT
jgi:hypothetical protein